MTWVPGALPTNVLARTEDARNESEVRTPADSAVGVRTSLIWGE